MSAKPGKLCVLAVLLLLALSAIAGSDWEEKARKRKADYVFLEAQSAFSSEDYATYLTLMQRAYELDSADIDIAGEWGAASMGAFVGDTAAQNKAYGLMMRRFLADPSNYNNGVIVAAAAKQLYRFDDLVRIWSLIDSAHPNEQEPAEALAQALVVKSIVGDTTALDRALAIYDRLEDGAGKNVPLSSQKIRAFLLRNDTAAVETELSELLREAPGDSYTALFAGSTYEYLNRPDSAIAYFNLACELDSANGSARMARANFYRTAGDSTAFDAEVFQALRSADLEVSTKLDLLRSYVAELYDVPAQRPRISQLFETLQQQHAGVADIHALYASYLYSSDSIAQGAEQMGYAVQLDPTNEQLWTSWVQMLALNESKVPEGQKAAANAAAADAAMQAQHRFPSNLYYPIVRASLLRETDMPAAISVLDSVDVSDVRNHTAVSNFLGFKGDLLVAAGDTAKALEVYDQAITLSPDNAGALNNTAYFIALQGGDLDKAERYSSRAIKAEPANFTYLDTYAWVLFKKREFELARQYIDATIRLYEEEKAEAEEHGEEIDPAADIFEHAGDIYYMCGMPDRALAYWQRALEATPDNDVLRRKVEQKKYLYK